MSTDVDLQRSSSVIADETPFDEVAAGSAHLTEPLGIPAEVDLTGYHGPPNGEQWFSVDTACLLPGDVFATPRDVVRLAGGIYSLIFSGATEGVPAGAAIDAVGGVDGDLLLSFDVDVELDGQFYADDDVVLKDSGGYSLFFQGSGAGIPGDLDVDAVGTKAASGEILLSFDGSGTAPGALSFDDEDVLGFDPTQGAWRLVFDASSQDAAWSAADLDALYLLGPTIFIDGFESGSTSAWSTTVPD